MNDSLSLRRVRTWIALLGHLVTGPTNFDELAHFDMRSHGLNTSRCLLIITSGTSSPVKQLEIAKAPTCVGNLQIRLMLLSLSVSQIGTFIVV